MMKTPAASQPIVPRTRFSWTGLCLLAIIALPMMAAYFIFKTGVGLPTTTINHGELLTPPKTIKTWLLKDTQGNYIQPLAENRKWRVIIPGRQHCDTHCRQQLYITRQVHIRLAEKAPRVERWYLNRDLSLDIKTAAFLKKEHPGLRIVSIDADQWQTWFDAAHKNPLPIVPFYLADPSGFAMMFYTEEHTGKDFLDDLKRLLKYSYEK